MSLSPQCLQGLRKNLIIECKSHDNGNGGFGTHLAASGTWKDIGPPDNPLNVMKNIRFVDCESYNNARSGFDLGVIKEKTILKNCKSHGNGSTGFKVWGDEVWLINCLVYENVHTGLSIKPLWEPSSYYILNNTFVNNNPSGQAVGKIRVAKKNGLSYTLKTANLYIYNNIMMNSSYTCISSDHNNMNIQGEDYNYYHRPSNSMVHTVLDGSWHVVESYTVKDMENARWYADKGLGQHDIVKTSLGGISDPGFKDRSSDDYSLKDSSSAVNTGMNGLGVTDDINGLQRPEGGKTDIGAFEYEVVKVAIRSPKNLSIVE